nr:immunoglobulin light chain junction region [Macaca mulatta]MOX57262.1 immunoglobulin light chain junction region [Macaca mulatta]
YMQYRYIPPTI